MRWRQLFQRKSLEILMDEMAGEHRLHRVLGPISLTSLGVGAIIGAGIFAITGRVASLEAGPAIMVSFIVASVACLFAALCYSEFAAMAPVAGSAYTYTYATLGEFLAWIIGWDLILEYAMSCSVVAAHWTGYFNEFVYLTFGWRIPPQWTSDPFTKIEGFAGPTYVNLPAMLIMLVITTILVVGIRESALTNAILVVVKLVVVLFVIVLGFGYINADNWTKIPVQRRQVTDLTDFVERNPDLQAKLPPDAIGPTTEGAELLEKYPEFAAGLTSEQKAQVEKLPNEVKKWGLLGLFGVKDWLRPVDEAVRSPFAPYGFSGIMVGAALVFFSYIGFDSISTHAEEAVNPQRDVPIGIIGSLILCTILYMLVSGVITGMEPYPDIETEAPIAAAFRKQAEANPRASGLLNASAWIISVGALAGMTSVLLVTFLSQSRIFLAMARDGLLPHSIFGVVHERFRTPHRSTIITGVCIILAAGLFPIRMLEEMVSIGTLLAFVMVCFAVLTLRVTRPEVHRPFRTPAIWFVAPAGALVSFAMMAFLPIDTWARLVVWLVLGLAIYFFYGMRHSHLALALEKNLKEGISPTDAPLR